MPPPLFPRVSAIAIVATLLISPAAAQTATAEPAPDPAPAESTPGDIVVVAERLPGSVITDVPIDEVLTPEDVASYGAGSFADLIGQLAVRTRSNNGRGGGAPVILLNGRRISGFGELANLVPEAIARVEIFPPEVALQYGYGADQRVINFVLKRNFSAITTNASLNAATAAERWVESGSASLLRLSGPSRINLTASAVHSGMMSEAARGIIQSSGNAGDGRLRTLLTSGSSVNLDGTIARPLSDVVGATLNLTYNRGYARGLNGPRLSDPATALSTENHTSSFHAGAGSDGRIGEWRWSLTGNYDRATSRAASERDNPLGGGTPVLIDRTRSASDTAEADMVLSGSLLNVPAGRVRATIQGGWKGIGFTSTSERGGTTTLTDLRRTAYSGSTNVDVPIASRDDDVLALLGDLSLNARYALRDVSDFQLLRSWTAGLSWSPIERLDILTTWTRDETAPGVSQLGAPALVTPLRTIYDFTRGETVLADVVSGGNPLLRAETRRDFRAQANWRPIEGKELLLTASYARVLSRNTTANFPLLTPEIEAAFPSRVARDGTGRITSIDQRPVNFAATRGRQIRYGISFSRSFGQPQRSPSGGTGGPPPAGGTLGGGVSVRVESSGGAAPPPSVGAPPGASAPRGPRGGGGFGGLFGGGGAGGRWSIAAYHTVRFEDAVVIRSGVPVLDLLNGSATGASGGSPRHEVEFDGGWFFKGVGVRANGTWRSATRVIGGPLPSGGTASDLSFSPQMTINLRGFIDLNQQTAFVAAHPVFRNSRIRIAIDNLFADTQEVRDAGGLVPLRYQAGSLNPVGRTIEVSIRKQF
ncbi:MAG: ABC transporter ATP-binding protein [Sphingopyxis sp.]